LNSTPQQFTRISKLGLFIPLFLSLVVDQAQAQSWYEIEVIIFEHVNHDNSTEIETWSSDLDLSWPSPLLELTSNGSTEQAVKPAFEEIARDNRRLNNDAYAFRVRDPYRLLWHKAWKAPLQDEDIAPWILVQADEQIGEHYRLEGGIRVHLSRYLHLTSDLWLTDIAPTNPSYSNQIQPSPSLAEDNVSSNNVSSNDASDGNRASSTQFFDWSQLPSPMSTRWPCNYFEEYWPDNQRFLPDEYYQNPQPLDWYFPFGCELKTNEQDFPLSVSLSLSDQNREAELRKNYPELFSNTGLPDSGLSFNSSEAIANSSNAIAGSSHYPLPQSISETTYPISRIIHINNSRRMRSGEVHYIDHPKIGILATIHPVPRPSSTELNEPSIAE